MRLASGYNIIIYGDWYKPLLLIILLAAQVSVSSAGDIYTWEDEHGVVHFSNIPNVPHANPAELPEIMRGEFKLGSPKVLSCKEHGGINCQAGPDDDGSVICHNGFRDADGRYRMLCMSPRLEIVDVSELRDTGDFSVFVRNTNSVTAEKPVLSYKAGRNSAIELSGPLEIEPYGLGEFVFKASPDIKVIERPSAAAFLLSCRNCP